MTVAHNHKVIFQEDTAPSCLICMLTVNGVFLSPLRMTDFHNELSQEHHYEEAERKSLMNFYASHKRAFGIHRIAGKLGIFYQHTL